MTQARQELDSGDLIDSNPAVWTAALHPRMNRYFREDHSTTGAKVLLRLNEKWSLGYEMNWEWKRRAGLLDRRFTAARNFHDFHFEFGFEFDEEDQDVTYFVNLTPKGFTPSGRSKH